MTMTTHSWKEVLTVCDLPLTGKLVFHLQNRGLNKVLLDGKSLSIPKEYMRALAELTEDFIFRSHGAYGELIDAEEISSPRRNDVKPITIRFYDGTPIGQHAIAHRAKQYFERKDKATHKESGNDLGFTVD